MGATARQPGRANAVLALIVTVQLMIVLDSTVVNLALPSIRDDLGFSSTGLAWVTNAYVLAFGGLLLLGGRLGDVLGRRRLLISGVLLFTVASLVGGAAPSDQVLIAARAVQGVGAAVAAPSALALLLATFAEGVPRNRALGLFFAMSAAGGAIGLLVGGALTTLSWRWVLWINVPPGLLIAALGLWLLPRTPRVHKRFDVLGALTSTAGLSALVLGFVRAGERGWGDGLSTWSFAASAVLLASFVVAERCAEQPLLPLRLLTERTTAFAYLTMMLVPAVMVAMYFFTAQFLQVVLAYSPFQTGLAFLPMSLLILLVSRRVPTLIPRFGPRPLMIVGASALLVAMLWLTRLSPTSDYPSSVGLPLALLGLGGGLLYVPLSGVLLSGVRPEDAGAASGAMQAVQQTGAALGIAVLVSVFGSALRRNGATTPDAFADAVTQAYAAGAAFAALVLVLVVTAVRHDSPAAGGASRTRRRPDVPCSARRTRRDLPLTSTSGRTVPMDPHRKQDLT